jgi:hypothetical protein
MGRLQGQGMVTDHAFVRETTLDPSGWTPGNEWRKGDPFPVVTGYGWVLP